jgi:tight adherence protein B
MLPTLIMFAGVLLTLVLGYQAVASPSATKSRSRRLDSVKERHSRSTEVAAEAQYKRILAARHTRMDGVAQRFIPNPALLRRRLEQTGKDWTLAKYAGASLLVLVTIAGLLMLRGAPAVFALVFGLFMAAWLPHFVVGFMIKRRVNQFTTRFPDAIELMVRGLRSGLPISETMNIVGTEVPGPVSVEFTNVADKMRIGRTMEAALQETADRLGTPEFQFFVITLAIQRETGGNLAETLSNLADVLRKRAQMKLKIRAMSSESKASAYIVGSLPFIVFTLIWFINGSYMQGFFTEPRLIVAGLGGLVWMAIGVLIMAKMVRFEI